MATYLELHELHSHAELKSRVEVAIVDVADGIVDEDPLIELNHVNRLLWSRDVLGNPARAAKEMYPAILVSSKGKTVQQIIDLTDNQIRNKLLRLVDLFATGPVTQAV